MLPEAWPAWLVVITGLGLVAAALLSILSFLNRAGRIVKMAAKWVHGVVVDAITDVVRSHTLSPQQVAEVVEAKVAPIHAEVRPNGGSSLKDQITRMEKRDGELSQLLHEHMRESALDRADLRQWLERLDHGRTSPRPPDDDGPAY